MHGRTICVVVAFAALCSRLSGAISDPYQLLLSDWAGDRITKYDPATVTYTALTASGAGGLDNPDGLVIAPDGSLLVANGWTNDVRRFNAKTGAYLGVFAAGVPLPILSKIGLDNNLYVASRDGDGIFQYNSTTGAFMRSFLNHDHGVLWWAYDIEFMPDGDLLLSSLDNGKILRFDGTTAQYKLTFHWTPGQSGGGMAWGPDGNLYVARMYSNRIDRLDGATGALLNTFAQGNGLNRPSDIAFTPDGRLYVTNERSPDISIFDATSGIAMGIIDVPGAANTGHSAILVIPEPGAAALVFAVIFLVACHRSRRITPLI